MKNKQKGLSLIAVLLLITGSLIIVGSIFYLTRDKIDQPPVFPPQDEEAKTEAPTTETVFSLSTSDSFRANFRIIKTAIEDKADTLINNPTTEKPEIKIQGLPTDLKNTISEKRQKINGLFKSNPESLSAEELALIISFLNDLQKIVTNLSPQNSGLSTVEINNYQSVVAGAQNDIQSSLSSSEADNNDASLLPDLSPFDRFGRPRLIEGSNRN